MLANQSLRADDKLMSRRDKDLQRLSVLDADLRRRLKSELRIVAGGQNTQFFMTREFNPHRLPDHLLSESAAALSDLASECLRLCASLNEPDGAPAATLFRRYLEKANNLADHHRLGPIRLAEELLAELKALEG